MQALDCMTELLLVVWIVLGSAPHFGLKAKIARGSLPPSFWKTDAGSAREPSTLSVSGLEQPRELRKSSRP